MGFTADVNIPTYVLSTSFYYKYIHNVTKLAFWFESANKLYIFTVPLAFVLQLSDELTPLNKIFFFTKIKTFCKIFDI